MKQPRIIHDRHFMALRKAKGSNVWLLTAFEKFEDGRGKEEGKTTPTEHQSYSSRTDAGASNKISVPSTNTQSNQKTRYFVRHTVEQQLDRPLNEVFDFLVDERIDEAHTK